MCHPIIRRAAVCFLESEDPDDLDLDDLRAALDANLDRHTDWCELNCDKSKATGENACVVFDREHDDRDYGPRGPYSDAPYSED